ASDAAAKAALTPQGKAKGLELYRSFMSQKTLTDARLDSAIRSAGLDPQGVRTAALSPEIEQQILDTRTLAQQINVKGTPTFVVGGQVVQGADIETLRQAISRARSASYEALASAR
ncbi:MAG: protein-disulfide isomerase, partial [Phenylobacterium sp.]|nr:protein-disulfide isomerase [Phenylobacterium sp.]